ncbi:MAG: hypothetical protein DRR08_01295 [Candidatus Parabeggiatoa sp. nov. 2]|nr:MAG: hypothetical protein B6247_01430 [Beggiatoa sp. 4572_84]RKZ64253.1 MAG: hypothetical protein DRR08_01295 [Gammaproteobacteria bacterium]HEC85965.1 hypothetical protein [Thioploca sp.]
MSNKPIEKNVRLIARHLYLPQASAKRRWPEIDAQIGQLLISNANDSHCEPVLKELRALAKGPMYRRREDLFEILMDSSHLLSKETPLYQMVLDFLRALYLELGNRQQKLLLEQLRTDAVSSHSFRRDIARNLLSIERPSREEVYRLQDMRQKLYVHNALLVRIVKFPDSFYEHYEALFDYIANAALAEDEQRIAQIKYSFSLISTHIMKAGGVTGQNLFTCLYRYYQYYYSTSVKGLFLAIITNLGDGIVSTIGEIYQQGPANRRPALDVLRQLISRRKSRVAMDKLFEIAQKANDKEELQTLALSLQKIFDKLFNTTNRSSHFVSQAQRRLEQLLQAEKPELIQYNPRLEELLKAQTQIDPNRAAIDLANDTASREERHNYRFGGWPLAEALTDIVCDQTYPESMRVNAAQFIPRIYKYHVSEQQLPKLRQAYCNINDLFNQHVFLETLVACNRNKNSQQDIELSDDLKQFSDYLKQQREQQPELRDQINEKWDKLVPVKGVIDYADISYQ